MKKQFLVLCFVLLLSCSPRAFSSQMAQMPGIAERHPFLMDAINNNNLEIAWYLLAFGVCVSERAQYAMQRSFPGFTYRTIS